MTDRVFAPGRTLTLCVFAALVVLLALGAWQWRKIGPKTEWIEQIKTGLSASPVSLSSLDPGDDLAYRKVLIEGRFMPQPALRLYGTNLSGRPGYHQFGLVNLADGGSILASIGWTAFDQDDAYTDWPDVHEMSGVLIGPGTKGSFTPDNEPTRNLWYWADLEAMGAAMGAEAVYPYRLILDQFAPHQDPASGQLQQFPLGGQVRVDIPNDHFEYALTWYGLACALIGVYVFFGYRRP